MDWLDWNGLVPKMHPYYGYVFCVTTIISELHTWLAKTNFEGLLYLEMSKHQTEINIWVYCVKNET